MMAVSDKAPHLAAVAIPHRLHHTSDAYGTPIVAGGAGSLTAEHDGAGPVSALVIERTARRWNHRRDGLIAAGC